MQSFGIIKMMSILDLNYLHFILYVGLHQETVANPWISLFLFLHSRKVLLNYGFLIVAALWFVIMAIWHSFVFTGVKNLRFACLCRKTSRKMAYHGFGSTWMTISILQSMTLMNVMYESKFFLLCTFSFCKLSLACSVCPSVILFPNSLMKVIRKVLKWFLSIFCDWPTSMWFILCSHSSALTARCCRFQASC